MTNPRMTPRILDLGPLLLRLSLAKAGDVDFPLDQLSAIAFQVKAKDEEKVTSGFPQESGNILERPLKSHI